MVETSISRPSLPSLSEETYAELFELLLRGASTHGAFVQLGLSCSELADRIEGDPRLGDLLRQVRTVQSSNVLAAFYQKAMKGSVSAQMFWLTHSPPPGWSQRRLSDADLDRLDPAVLAAKAEQYIDSLPDEELDRLAGAWDAEPDVPGAL